MEVSNGLKAQSPYQAWSTDSVLAQVGTCGSCSSSKARIYKKPPTGGRTQTLMTEQCEGTVFITVENEISQKLHAEDNLERSHLSIIYSSGPGQEEQKNGET